MGGDDAALGLLDNRHPDRADMGGSSNIHERWGSGMNDWREELIETIALQIGRAQFGDWVINPTEKMREQARAALAVAEPVIREQCAEMAEKSLGTWGAANALYIAAAIRKGGKGNENNA